MTSYVFTAERAGICTECGEEYRPGAAVHLTAAGVVHPDCDGKRGWPVS